MRIWVFALAAALAACASEGANAPDAAWPFPVARGAAPAPPARVAAGQTAPPEGMGPGGVDFGRWRQGDPGRYGPEFQTQLARRYAGLSQTQIRADLETNGFACADAGRLDCRIEIMERQCAFDWYVVVEPAQGEPIAGFDIMCLGARQGGR